MVHRGKGPALHEGVRHLRGQVRSGDADHAVDVAHPAVGGRALTDAVAAAGAMKRVVLEAGHDALLKFL